MHQVGKHGGGLKELRIYAGKWVDERQSYNPA
jgi:hypothetical protein